MESPEIIVTSAAVEVTDRCNFNCSHCCQGGGKKAGATDMTPADMDLLLDRVDAGSERFSTIVLFGGEPRLNRHLHELLGVIQNRNKKRASPMRNVNVFTNGFGMNSPEDTMRIIRELVEKGATSMTVSTDLPHIERAAQLGMSINYEILRNWANLDPKEKEKHGIPTSFTISTAGNGNYVIPIGNARNFSWEERLAYARSGREEKRNNVTEDMIQRERGDLRREFSDWDKTVLFTQTSYCNVAHSRRYLESTQSEYKVSATTRPDLSISPCSFSIMPAVGNLREDTMADIARRVRQSPLYGIIAHQGPQGLMARLTGKGREEILEQYVERTPCGMCEDLMRDYGDEIRKLL